MRVSSDNEHASAKYDHRIATETKIGRDRSLAKKRSLLRRRPHEPNASWAGGGEVAAKRGSEGRGEGQTVLWRWFCPVGLPGGGLHRWGDAARGGGR